MSFSQNPNVEEVVPANGMAVGFKGGRPPDEVADEVVNILERSGSPVPEVVQPLLKRGRNLEEAMLIDDESGQVAPEGVVLVGDGSQVQAAADGLSAPSIPSFKDKLVGFTVVSSTTRSLSDLDVDVKEDDVVNRCRRQGAAIPNREPRTDTSIANGGSRFAVLEEEGNKLGGEVVVSKQPEEKVEEADWNGREALGCGRGRVRIISRSPSPKKDEADRLKVANIGGSAATPPPLPHLGEDVLGWRWDAKREFRVSSAYSFLMHEGERISKLGQRGSMQGCQLATPPAAIAIAIAEEKCHGRVGFESAVVDIEGSGSVDGSGLAVMDWLCYARCCCGSRLDFGLDAVDEDCFGAAVDTDWLAIKGLPVQVV
ncbi:hypothetical protein V6N13_123742 [Hibiscus sabdariffa]